MTTKPFIALSLLATFSVTSAARAQSSTTYSPPADTALDGVKELVGRLDLDKYKATIKGLTQFGDRRQGTDRNRQAVDWIEAQLKSYGCQDIGRIFWSRSVCVSASARLPRFRPAPNAGLVSR